MGEWTWRAFKIVQSLVERLPRPWAYALAVTAARLAWRFSPLARPRLEHNLKIACPGAAGRPGGVAASVQAELSESRQGLRRPDAASEREDRGHAAAAEGDGFGKSRRRAQPGQGRTGRVLPYGFVRGGVGDLGRDAGT